jgi:ABC-type polysaccharide/polyol phosphate export permease
MITYALSILCVRFRDIGQIVGIIMQASFLVTPVMWNIDMLPPQYKSFIYINPFASIIEIARAPFMGYMTDPLAYLSLLCWSVFAFLCAFIMYRIFHKNLVFWM